MAQVIFCVLFAGLFLWNSVVVEDQSLIIIDTIAAVFYTVIGAYAGWLESRK